MSVATGYVECGECYYGVNKDAEAEGLSDLEPKVVNVGAEPECVVVIILVQIVWACLVLAEAHMEESVGGPVGSMKDFILYY